MTIRRLSLRLDIINSQIVPFLLGVLRISLEDTDGNDRGEDDHTFDVAA